MGGGLSGWGGSWMWAVVLWVERKGGGAKEGSASMRSRCEEGCFCCEAVG